MRALPAPARSSALSGSAASIGAGASSAFSGGAAFAMEMVFFRGVSGAGSAATLASRSAATPGAGSVAGSAAGAASAWALSTMYLIAGPVTS